MCIIAFHAFLRIGELCCKSSDGSSIIQFEDVQLLDHTNGPRGVEIKLKQYKHSKQPVTLFLPQNLADPILCPLSAVRTYLNMSSHSTGAFFQLPNGQAVSYAFFTSHLKSAITFLGFDANRYKSHSFRIGAATHAVMQGFSEEMIQKMGRWKSNALKNYIRLPQLKLVQ